MAYSEALQTITLVAAADLSSNQYCFVSVDATGKAALTGAGAQADGVLQNKPVAGEAATVAISGVSKVLCVGAVTAGGLVASAASGKATDAASGDNICAVALELGAANRLISVLLKTQNANAIA